VADRRGGLAGPEHGPHELDGRRDGAQLVGVRDPARQDEAVVGRRIRDRLPWRGEFDLLHALVAGQERDALAR